MTGVHLSRTTLLKCQLFQGSCGGFGSAQSLPRSALSSRSGSARALPKGRSALPEETIVPPAGGELHLRIASDFLADGGLPDELGKDLQAITPHQTHPDAAWWRVWTEKLRAAGPVLYNRWHEMVDGPILRPNYDSYWSVSWLTPPR